MRKETKRVVYASVIAVLYVVLTHFQNILLPGSATWAIQMRLSEALGILCFFTPWAVPGLTVGCLLFNLTYAAALPLDIVIGSLATFLASQGMWMTRNLKIMRIPLLGLLLPALTNALLVGWELSVYIGGAFAVNAVYVALGEVIVMLTFGLVLYLLMKKRGLHKRFFPEFNS